MIGAEGATVAAIAGFDGYVITDLAAAPEGNRVHAGLSLRSAYYQYDAGLVGVIDTAANALIDTIDPGASPDTINVSTMTTNWCRQSTSPLSLSRRLP